MLYAFLKSLINSEQVCPNFDKFHPLKNNVIQFCQDYHIFINLVKFKQITFNLKKFDPFLIGYAPNIPYRLEYNPGVLCLAMDC